MKFKGFQLEVVGADEAGGYAAVPHGTQYKLKMTNNTTRRCDAEVTIDGKKVGGWRINLYGSITLERPADDTGKFTFYKSGSGEASLVGEKDVALDQRGLISVRFRPEVERKTYMTPTSSGTMRGAGGLRSLSMFGAGAQSVPRCGGEEKTSGGVTGLSGRSDQKFVEVPNLEYDPDMEVTIHLRLVHREDGPRPLASVVHSRETPVPPPVQ